LAETYLTKKKRSDAVEEEKNRIIFGLMGGIILIAFGALNWLSATGLWEIACVCLAALGLLLVMLAVVVPAFLKYPYKAFRFFGNTAGKVVFAVVLAVLYFVFILPVGLILRRKREAQGYFTWKNTPPKPQSLFVAVTQTDGSATKKRKASYLGITYQLFSVFAGNRKYILIPVVIILVIVGLVLFFVSSNVMTAFIYTLF